MERDFRSTAREIKRVPNNERGGWEGRKPSFLPKPLPALLLAPFFARSLTLVPHSLLLNRTETLATQARRHILHYTVEPLYNPTMETVESGLCGGVLNKSQCVDFFCPPGRQKVAVVDQRGGH